MPVDGDLSAGTFGAVTCFPPPWPDDDPHLDAGHRTPGTCCSSRRPSHGRRDHDGPGDLDFGQGRTEVDHGGHPDSSPDVHFGAAARHTDPLHTDPFAAQVPTGDVHDSDHLALPDPFEPHHDPHGLDVHRPEPGFEDGLERGLEHGPRTSGTCPALTTRTRAEARFTRSPARRGSPRRTGRRSGRRPSAHSW
jgi:hypothetical protein